MELKISGNGISGPEQAVSQRSEGNLAKTCRRAAEHMAQARKALDSKSLGPDEALAHLDDAIACLQRLSPQSTTSKNNADNTLAALHRPKERRSA